MKRNAYLIWGLALLMIGLLGLAGAELIGSYSQRGYEREFGRRGYGPGSMMGPGGMMGSGGMMGYMMRDYSKESYSSNGEEIYLTGRGGSGGRVYSNFGMMRVGCANCHGTDGRGGLEFSEGIASADIRFKSLAKEGMTEQDVKRAITEGIDEKGDTLSPDMPRWSMDDRDLNDLVKYLKTL